MFDGRFRMVRPIFKSYNRKSLSCIIIIIITKHVSYNLQILDYSDRGRLKVEQCKNNHKNENGTEFGPFAIGWEWGRDLNTHSEEESFTVESSERFTINMKKMIIIIHQGRDFRAAQLYVIPTHHRLFLFDVKNAKI